jgi:DNA repair exonuclease SbcCD ATPase subunit
VPVLEQQLDDARRANLELAAATRERAALLQQADRLNDDVVRLDREAGQLAGRAMELHAKADELAQHDDGRVCEACGQPLSTAEARAQVIVGWREQAEALMADSVAKSNDSTELEAQQSELRELAAAVTVPERATRRRSSATRRRARRRRPAARPRARSQDVDGRCSSRSRSPHIFLEADAELDVRQAAYDEAVAAVGDREALERDVDTARGGCCRSASGSTAPATEHARVWVPARPDQHRPRRARRAARRQRGAARAARPAEARRARVRPRRHPALIVENAAIPQIETEANRILDELGTSYRVELRTQRALKTSETLRETLDILIHADAGERPYETFSGGERTRLNLALRIALARLLAHRRGAESRLLVIDEPEYLDEAGVARLAEVLRGLAGDFDRSPDLARAGAGRVVRPGARPS